MFNFFNIPKILSVNWDEYNFQSGDSKEFANFIFELGLQADQNAITECYFKNNKDGANIMLLQAAALFKEAANLNPNHPYAHTFAIAHDSLDDLNNPIEGDKDAQMAVSGLYADGIEEGVPDNAQIQAFWVLKASLNPGASMPSAGKSNNHKTWINFIENKLVSMFGSVAAGAVGGFTIGQTITQQTGETYWTYIGIGVGGGLGFIGWFCSLNFYNIYHWWTTHRNAKKALKDLDTAFDDLNNENAPTIVSIDDKDIEPNRNISDIEQNENAHSGEVAIEIPKILTNNQKRNLKRKHKKALNRFKEFIKTHGPDHDVVMHYIEKTKEKRIAHKNNFLETVRSSYVQINDF